MPSLVLDRSARVALANRNADALLAEALARLARPARQAVCARSRSPGPRSNRP